MKEHKMQNTIKFVVGMSFLAFLDSSAFAKDGDIYGWDISCKGDPGVLVHAFQSDDDFNVSYMSNEVDANKVYATGNSEYNSTHKILLFNFTGKNSADYSGALVVVRDKTVGDGAGVGVLHLVNKLYDPLRYDLRCYVRSASTEEAFGKLTKAHFPQF